uniref:Uncharacterized protein n=1 Tax=Noccaea caerulescens TaxID=107243 RepID=A0A1J3G0Q8_NOCCA
MMKSRSTSSLVTTQTTKVTSYTILIHIRETAVEMPHLMKKTNGFRDKVMKIISYVEENINWSKQHKSMLPQQLH